MSLLAYDLDRIGNPIGKLGNALERLVKAHERQADAYERIAHSLEQHWGIPVTPKKNASNQSGGWIR